MDTRLQRRQQLPCGKTDVCPCWNPFGVLFVLLIAPSIDDERSITKSGMPIMRGQAIRKIYYKCMKNKILIAPMMDWTDRHCRYFLRLLSPNARLYTEMVTAAALIHGDAEKLLVFDAAEHPVALQLGGGDPDALARCARLGEEWGYDEVNLNGAARAGEFARGVDG